MVLFTHGSLVLFCDTLSLIFALPIMYDELKAMHFFKKPYEIMTIRASPMTPVVTIYIFE